MNNSIDQPGGFDQQHVKFERIAKTRASIFAQ